MNYLLVVVILGLLFLAHELGHFVAARLGGIPVARLSVGFGPKLWGFRRRETEYWVSAIPLGGYVLPEVEDEHDYFRIPLNRRLVFCVGGPLANVVVAAVLFMILNVASQGVSIGGLLVAPVVQTGHLFVQVLVAILRLFVHPEGLSSLLGIVVGGGEYVAGGWIRTLQFSAFLSVSLAVFNLLPIPGLDGGKLVLHLLEKICPKATRVFVPLSVLGLILVLGLIVYATALDIGRYLL